MRDNVRFTISRNSTNLRISEVISSDAGRYECEAANTLATVSTYAFLTVRPQGKCVPLSMCKCLPLCQCKSLPLCRCWFLTFTAKSCIRLQLDKLNGSFSALCPFPVLVYLYRGSQSSSCVKFYSVYVVKGV